MTIKDFVNKAIEQDDRNVFEPCDTVDNLPKDIVEFYKNDNPVDVELNFEGIIVRFFPYDELEMVQKEYALPESAFVFATSNGDPIYLMEGEIYIGLHGSLDNSGELFAESLEKLFDKIS